MNLFLLVILLLVTLGMIGIILLQRSESGGLGTGGGMGSLMSARGRKDFMTRTTAILATCFMVLCILLAILTSRQRHAESSLLQEEPVEMAQEALEQEPVLSISGSTAPSQPTEKHHKHPLKVAPRAVSEGAHEKKHK